MILVFSFFLALSISFTWVMQAITAFSRGKRSNGLHGFAVCASWTLFYALNL